MSRRLVEYFVMVSALPIQKDGEAVKSKDCKNKPPPDPSRVKMNSRTAGRFAVRRAHLSTSEAPQNVPTINEKDANDETTSTTSIASIVDENPEELDTLKPSSVITSSVPQESHSLGSKSIDDDTADYLLEPVITARYPATDHEDQPLNPRLPQFCHPEGTELIQVKLTLHDSTCILLLTDLLIAHLSCLFQYVISRPRSTKCHGFTSSY